MPADQTYQNAARVFKPKGEADIVFLVDATGSMGPCIDALRDSMNYFIDMLTTVGDPQTGIVLRDWRISICAYRDFTCKEDMDAGIPALEVTPFSRDRREIRTRIASITPTGGGDDPESLLDALYLIMKWKKTAPGASPEEGKWRARGEAARCILVFTDAPYHPTMAIPEAAGATYKDLKNLIHQERFRLMICAPTYPCYDALSSFNRSVWYEIDNEEEDGAKALRRYVEGAESNDSCFRKALANIVRTVTQSGVHEAAEKL